VGAIDNNKISDILHEIIRVDHAGELGAKRIYEGQLAALKGSCDKDVLDAIEHMYNQELEHFDKFNTLMKDNLVRPTVFSPLWNIGAYALGWISGKMGPKSAMAVTIAVENVIDDHYAGQEKILEKLACDDGLRQMISKFRQEEIDHKDDAVNYGGMESRYFSAINFVVSGITKAAIALSKRL
jgi:ubiquinone biosynthesis monooxygenase Coq7